MCADTHHIPDNNQNQNKKKTTNKSGKRKITREDLKDPKIRKLVLKKIKEKKEKERQETEKPPRHLPTTPKESSPPFEERDSRTQSSVPTRTISRNHYRQSSSRIRKRTIINIITFSIITIIALACIAFFVYDRYRRGQIFDNANAALVLLEQKQGNQALRHMNIALDVYSQYHIWEPGLWWNGDGALFTLMLRVAQGYRSLGEYEKGIETFRQVCLHNSEGEGNWIARKIHEELLEFTDKEHWLDRECAAIYQHLLREDTDDWGTGDIVLIRATEWMGLNTIPMKRRFNRLEFAAYAESFERKAVQKKDVYPIRIIRFYIVDRLPQILDLHLSQSMKDYERKRFLWYINSDRKYLLFGRFVGNGALFDGIENILLSEKENVEQFNSVVLGVEESEETPVNEEES